ncbi:Enamine deaminase RidA, house cleaning of reactive enamine intermediates, YjgF/YER057c/UK114 family [Rhizobium sp. NFR07]|uniref:RidA family protein n=1 Tax=Rhizobium sp. NFR07 TaxID=1566262 RepID=UPI0008F06CCF|nr:RidA family protein [Rhizobium sp. NFR07]SFB63020.1 Enamine deaminase RidA, house cleaning of reactive enamine intermediates, YjgF/YER057c/UK114 family [Rhizobium sp. NFR07]
MIDSPENRLAALNMHLPTTSAPAGKLVGFKIVGDLVFVSGQLPLDNGALRYVGKVGLNLDEKLAAEAARLSALNVIAQLSTATRGKLSEVEEIVRLSGYLNCSPDFTTISPIIDHASEVFEKVFRAHGRHARTAIGVMSLPRGAPVEIEVIARVSKRVTASA